MNNVNEKITVELTSEDKKILNSYSIMIDGLANYLGENYEFVLHSLDNLDSSIIKIVNGFHSNRSIGNPITDLALKMLKQMKSNKTTKYISYFNKKETGEHLKSSTIAIEGINGKIIGLLCINLYLDNSFYSFLKSYQLPEHKEGELTSIEHFSNNSDITIIKALQKEKSNVFSDNTISAINKNKEIINRLNEKGFFELKNAINLVATELNISKNTVYLHLRNLKDI